MADREMLLKCARALFELDQEQPYVQYSTNPLMYGIKGKVSWDHITDEEKVIASVVEGYASKAIAVIKSLREPTEAMKRAGEFAYIHGSADAYRAMIDDILEK